MSKPQSKTPEVSDAEVDKIIKSIKVTPPETHFWTMFIKKIESEIRDAKREIIINTHALAGARIELKNAKKHKK